MGGVLVHEVRRVTFEDLSRELLAVPALALAPARPHGVDARALGHRVRLREKPSDRDLGRVGVGEAVGGGELDRLDQVVEVLHGVVAPRRDVVTLEDVQRLEHLEG